MIDNFLELAYNSIDLGRVNLDDCRFCNHQKFGKILFRPQVATTGLTLPSSPKALEADAFTTKKQTGQMLETSNPLKIAVTHRGARQ